NQFLCGWRSPGRVYVGGAHGHFLSWLVREVGLSGVRELPERSSIQVVSPGASESVPDEADTSEFDFDLWIGVGGLERLKPMDDVAKTAEQVFLVCRRQRLVRFWKIAMCVLHCAELRVVLVEMFLAERRTSLVDPEGIEPSATATWCLKGSAVAATR